MRRELELQLDTITFASLEAIAEASDDPRSVLDAAGLTSDDLRLGAFLLTEDERGLVDEYLAQEAASGSAVHEPLAFSRWTSEQPKGSSALEDRWEPYLHEFFGSVTHHITANTQFYHQFSPLQRDERFKAAFCELTRFDKSSAPSQIVLQGNVGIGKSSFLRWWCHEDGRAPVTAIFNANSVRESIVDIERDQEIARSLGSRFVMQLIASLRTAYGDRFTQILSDAVEGVRAAFDIHQFDQAAFREGLLHQSDEFRATYPQLDPTYALLPVVEAANQCARMPVVLIVDNIDQHSRALQTALVKAACEIYDRVIENSSALQAKALFHLVVAARDRTYLSVVRSCGPLTPVMFPPPPILAIVKQRVSDALESVASRDSEARSVATSLAHQIEAAVANCLSAAAWPDVGYDPDSWHRALVNNNVRRLLTAWTNLVLAGSAIDLWTPRRWDGSGRYKRGDLDAPSPYRYMRFLFRGSFSQPATGRPYSATGADPRAPLAFNLFGVSRERLSDADFARHYLIFVRVLQALARAPGERLTYGELEQLLAGFFEEALVLDATRELLWFRVIDERAEGIINIEARETHRAIQVEPRHVLHLSTTGKLYYGSLLSSYEYIAAMALASWQVKNQYNEDPEHQRGEHLAVRDARAVLAFLASYRDVLIHNLRYYRRRNLLSRYLTSFSPREQEQGPWERMFREAHGVLRRQARYRAGARRRTHSIEHDHGDADQGVAEKLERIREELARVFEDGIQEIARELTRS